MLLKNVSPEEMYLVCARLKNEVALNQDIIATVGNHSFSHDILTVCNEMIELLDQMPQLERDGKLASLIKEVYNHVNNW